MLTALLTILGLVVFEVISSIDNAVINAEVLATMSKKGRRWFLLWGIVIAVFVVRGLLPWAIIWAVNPGLGPVAALMATFSGDPAVHESIERTAPILLAGGGTFLVFLFFHWLFLEPKNLGFPRTERFFMSKSVWFYAVVSVLLTFIVWQSLNRDPLMALGAVVGSTAFFITHGFKENAERSEEELLRGKNGLSDLSKIFYLEIIDTTFSIDGVLGAFAFTFSVPLILIGNGIGALVVRDLTIRNVDKVKKYAYLKNGAMYSIAVLGLIMLLDGFGFHIPEWASPVSTFAIIGYFFAKSLRRARQEEQAENKKPQTRKKRKTKK